jgi:hypothetical protein
MVVGLDGGSLTFLMVSDEQDYCQRIRARFENHQLDNRILDSVPNIPFLIMRYTILLKFNTLRQCHLPMLLHNYFRRVDT